MTDESVLAEYSVLNATIAEVLFHVTNFPESAQTHLLGQDMGPLRERLVNAVWNAGFTSRQVR